MKSTELSRAWARIFESTIKGARKAAASVGQKPAAVEAAVRRHRERAAREPERKPVPVAKRWLMAELRRHIERCGYRTTTHGHVQELYLGEPRVEGTVVQCWPNEVGLPSAYGTWRVACSRHRYTVRRSWLRDVKLRGAAIVSGMLTLDLGPEVEAGIFQAYWVEGGRGASLRGVHGYLVHHRPYDVLWQHADSLAQARRVLAFGRDARRPMTELPQDAAALLRRARLSGDEPVTVDIARCGGRHCYAGIRDWCARHAIELARGSVSTREVAELAAESGDRLAEVYAVLLAAKRAARQVA